MVRWEAEGGESLEAIDQFVGTHSNTQGNLSQMSLKVRTELTGKADS